MIVSAGLWLVVAMLGSLSVRSRATVPHPNSPSP